MEKLLAFELVLLSIFFTTTSHAEFVISTQTTYSQAYPDVAPGNTQSFIAVWRSYRQDGDSGGVYYQRFDSAGHKLGPEYRVNSITQGDQTEPSIAATSNGGYVIVWQGPGPDEEDIFARRFDPNGNPLGDEFQVNTVTEGAQCHPKVATSGNGRFVVVWQSEISKDNSQYRTCTFQIYDAQGSRLCQEIQFDALSDCRYPDVAMDYKGNFVVVWMQDESHNSIMARAYNSSGYPKNDPCQVNTTDFTSVTRPSIAMSADGSFVVAWDGHDRYASMDDIHARMFEPDVNAIGEQFIVNTTQTGKQEYPVVSLAQQKQFVIIWHSNTGNSHHKKDIYGRMFDSEGQPIGHDFCPHTYVSDDQKYPSVAMTQSNLFFCVWQSYKQDGSDYGVFGSLGPSTQPADFTGDDMANFRDFSLMASEWSGQNPTCQTDLTSDNQIDIEDLAEFCNHWLCNDWP